MTAAQQRRDTLRLVGHMAVAAALVFLGVMSVVNRAGWSTPTDGVVWAERGGALVATAVAPEGPGARAGLRPGDRLLRVGGVAARPPMPEAVEYVLWSWGVGSQVDYEVERGGTSVRATVTVGGVPVDNRSYYYLCLVGAAFLVTGIFALLRGQQAGAALRFFWLAMAAYGVLVLSFTEEGDPFARTIFWVDQTARLALPGLFLYFALTFPRPKPHYLRRRAGWLLGAFAPGLLLWLASAALVLGEGLVPLTLARRYALLGLGSRLELVYLAAALGLGVLLFAHSYKATRVPRERKRLKWLVGGTALGIFPFVAIYVPLFVLGVTRSPYLDLAVLPLLLVPLSFAYAVVGFRLWDVEVILKRGLAYAVAALAVLAVYRGAAWGFERLLAEIDPQLVQTAALVATLLVALAFGPLRDRVQEWLDRLYYRERYRARRRLLDFARELNTELDVGQLVEAVVQRVRQMTGVGGVAVFLRDKGANRFRLAPTRARPEQDRWLSVELSAFLAAALEAREFLYVDDLSGLAEEFPDDRELLLSEDLVYFLPLISKGEVVGILALGRTLSGDYLSSEDIRVLQLLASHAALAIDNALLYQQVERRAGEFERLKTYNENILESINVGVMALDLDGRVLSWNRSLEALHGIPRDEAVGSRIEDLFPAAFVSALRPARQRVERGQEPLASAYRVALRTRHGRDRVVNLSVAPLLGQEGRTGTVIILDDVTERTELEAQLRQAEKLASVGLLAAGVAHEVNTPLAGISSYVQMLQRRLRADDPRRPILEKIEKQTFRASRIVNNLLNFARQQPSEMREVDLNDVVNETLSLADPSLAKRHIRVQTSLAEGLPPVWGDPVKLQQVLMNLVLNARDSMPNGGDLRISTVHHDAEVRVEVADTGRGIPPEDIHKIYDPFFTTKRGGRGTGLGLSVTYGIVQEHRGAISVDSVPGRGTRFRVTFPVAAPDRARAAS